jgi:23S rRNA C2498 (ribose-2'-O)-methylase RlmM
VGRSLLESTKKIIPSKAITQHNLKYYLKVLKIPRVRDIFMNDAPPRSPLKMERGILNLDVKEVAGTH